MVFGAFSLRPQFCFRFDRIGEKPPGLGKPLAHLMDRFDVEKVPKKKKQPAVSAGLIRFAGPILENFFALQLGKQRGLPEVDPGVWPA